MKPALRRGAPKTVAIAAATPAARKWSSPDFPRATAVPVVKAGPKHSMHYRVISRTAK